ncbi:MAG: glycosyltransferase family 2 protein [Deltaproteobacteria bacterium]
MLSILIPIYNINCAGLVEDLILQCKEISIEFEVICIDDHSKDQIIRKNEILNTIPNIRYHKLTENIGRARIRNLLAEKAKYEYLLFLDADSGIIRNDFISKYIEYAKNMKVIYGGTRYSFTVPGSKNKMLHWKYASKYEALEVAERNAKPYLAFMSNNFLIDRKIFNSILFDNMHSGYGYEDTLFAEELKKIGVVIYHIDNPVEHTGLSDSDSFLVKTNEAMKNLARLYLLGKMPETVLINFYRYLKKNNIDQILSFMIRLFLPIINYNLKSGFPILVFFQLYKYYYFHKNLKINKINNVG